MTAASPQARFTALGLTLPPAPKPIGAYTPALVVGPHLYLSGHLPTLPDGSFIKGRVGGEHAADAARGIELGGQQQVGAERHVGGGDLPGLGGVEPGGQHQGDAGADGGGQGGEGFGLGGVEQVAAGAIDIRGIDLPAWLLPLPIAVGSFMCAVEFLRFLFTPRSYFTAAAASKDSIL